MLKPLAIAALIIVLAVAVLWATMALSGDAAAWWCPNHYVGNCVSAPRPVPSNVRSRRICASPHSRAARATSNLKSCKVISVIPQDMNTIQILAAVDDDRVYVN